MREANGYLVVEDRHPHQYNGGSAVISKVYVNKPSASQVPVGARLIPITLRLPNNFFTAQRVTIDVPEQDPTIGVADV